MRVTLAVEAENEKSRRMVVEISWDGVWSAELDQVRMHLVVKEVPLGG